MIIDEAKIYVKAGDGGDGGIYFRHEKYVPKGGPDGGDGGNGGNVIFRSSEHEHDLRNYVKQRKFLAQDGANGMKQLCSGKKGEDLILDVPLGTQIFEGDNLLIDMTESGMSYRVAKGGSGGWGNHHFATSVKQAPEWAKEGLPGEERNLRLELKMIADVGLVGLPNAGKSTLLSVLSNARPKIADYPFTTLEPNLGVVRTPERSIVIADIPGLIEGASKGKGLGDKFLKHIERTKTILHLVAADSEDPFGEFEIIKSELADFSDDLAKKQKMVILTKCELIDDDRLEEIIELFNLKKVDVLAISAQTHHNIDKLVYEILKLTK